MPTCMGGVMRCFSNAYFTKKTTARNRMKPPIQAKSFTPKNFSQLICAAAGAGPGIGCRGEVGGCRGVAATVAAVLGTGSGARRGLGGRTERGRRVAVRRGG